MTIVKSFLRRSKSGKMVRVRAHRRDGGALKRADKRELKRAMKQTKVFIGKDVKIEKVPPKNLGRKEILVSTGIKVVNIKEIIGR